MKGSQDKFENVHFTEYNGNPLLVFGKPFSKFHFAFGKAKAKLLLEAMKETGLEKFKTLLEDFAA